jgi:YegS/Rv2252/BmrU family lipid kinase
VIHVIYNPVAGPKSVRKVDRIRAALSKSGRPFVFHETGGPGDATLLAREAAASGAEAVVAAGGDGTINEIANGLAGSDVPLLIVAHGTGNVFARELSLPHGVEDCLALIASGRTITVPLARAEGRYFAIVASAGFDAEVVERVRSSHKNRLGLAAYVLMGIRHWLRSQPSLWLEFPGRERMEAQAVVLCRGRLYGGGVVMAPGADLESRGMHAIVLAKRGRLALLCFVLNVLRGKHLASRNVAHRVTDSLWVRSTIPSAAQIDGEYLGPLPARFEMTDRTLRILVPETYSSVLNR